MSRRLVIRCGLHVTVPRFTCPDLGCTTHIFRAPIGHIAEPRAVVTVRTRKWILQRIVIDKMSVAAVAANLKLPWKTASQIALGAARALVYDGTHLDGVRHLGVDEHKWKHVRGQGDSSWVTVIIDLTPVIDGTGPGCST